MNKMNIRDRINFYLGNCDNPEITTNIDLPVIKQGNNVYYIYNKTHKICNIIKNNYLYPLDTLINECKIINKNIYILVGDIYIDYKIKAFAKTRPSYTNSHVLLKCLNKPRHWTYFVHDDVLDFKKKLSKVVWRGSSTGADIDKNNHLVNIHEANRLVLVEKYFNNEDVDIGFSRVLPEFHKEYGHLIKNSMSLEEMCRYKYIISVEGNDKDSGLNWKLRSKSVVLMPKPTITSWLMEETLIPNIHYIEIKNDFSDLIDKIQWCNDNQQICQEIVSNANDYMKQFEDTDQELEIEKHIITKLLNDK